MTYHYHHSFNDYDNTWDDNEHDAARQDRRARRHREREAGIGSKRARKRTQRPPRTERDQAFKCGHCKQFIGAPISGGRHRNHCPNCLHSKHVDAKTPGDRLSECRSLMAPVGVLNRRNGEQVILHRCLGCGKESPNRIAADDNPVALLRIPPVPPLPPVGKIAESVILPLDSDISFDEGDDVQSA